MISGTPSAGCLPVGLRRTSSSRKMDMTLSRPESSPFRILLRFRFGGLMIALARTVQDLYRGIRDKGDQALDLSGAPLACPFLCPQVAPTPVQTGCVSGAVGDSSLDRRDDLTGSTQMSQV